MDDLLSEFLTETNESLDDLDVELVRLEQNPNDPDLISGIFRLVHTIKGTCGFLGLPRLESLAHAAENVLGNFRDKTQEVTPPAVTLILESVDRIKLLLAVLEETEAEPEGDDSDLISRLDEMYQSGKSGAAAPLPEAEPQQAAAEVAPTPEQQPSGSLLERMGGISVVDAAIDVLYRKILKDPDLTPFFEGADTTLVQGRQVEFLTKALGGPDEYGGRDLRTAHKHLVESGLNATHFDKVADYLSQSLTELEVSPSVIGEVMAIVDSTRGDVLDMDEHEQETVGAPSPIAVAPEPEESPEPAGVPETGASAEPPADTPQAKESSVANQSIRVNVDVLENLMTMVSELVLTRNQLMQMVRKFDDSEFKVPLQRLSHVTTDLQEGVMKTRMQPIGNAWGKLPRIIRDLSHELDKKIDLQMLGADTELDRQVLEMIKDPLTHMVRNSADHGIEMPADRVTAGKPENGTVVLNAYHEGGHIIIEISDDGQGIHVDRVKKKVIEKNLATEADMDTMSEQQILQYIFKAGFSTAEKVTSVSGRGVGMDVVRTNIEKIGGQVELRSQSGRGSTFTIKIPLTLAIVSALIVECGGEKFAIPQLSVVELVRITHGSEHRIEKIKDTPVLRLRDRLLPLVSLSELLGLGANGIEAHLTDAGSVAETDETDGEAKIQTAATADTGETFIVISQVGTYSFGIIVDRVFDTEEIVVKPVAPILRDIAIYSGNTILGDGSVIMILDPNGIAAATGEIMLADQAGAKLAESGEGSGKEKTAFLVFRTKAREPKAVPLALVARLEELDRSTFEISNGAPVVQYRGSLMPLMTVDETLELESEGRQPILVFTDRERSMGLIVEEIVDIVEDYLNIELASANTGLIGSAVIGGQATDVIDASVFLTRAFGDWYGSNEVISNDVASHKKSILLVDDSPFFRNLLTPLLKVAGYEVTTADSGDSALGLREAGKTFDIIVSDIEMPGMTGFDLAQRIRDGGPWQDTPLVALSSHTLPADLQKGRQVGFDDYVTKLDRDALLQSLTETLSGMRGAA
jgi:two-component system chemotaxis sensor kinase CheA